MLVKMKIGLPFLVSFLMLLCVDASAQLSVPLNGPGETRSKGTLATENGMIINTEIDMSSIPVEYGKYSDTRLEQLEKEMSEREWNKEETAWEKARGLDTKEAYEKYIGMYPYGAHRADASKRLVDIKVEDTFSKDHGSLPGMTHTEKDDNSPTSLIIVENATQYILTVMYSGSESKSVQIGPGTKVPVKLPNGPYRIAASVPVATVKPFAGSEYFTGGRYEVGFCIVTR